MGIAAQGEVWRFITLYKSRFSESLSYIRLMQDPGYRKAALERATREGDGELQSLAQRLRRAPTAGEPAAPAAAPAEPAAADGANDRPAALAELEQRLGAALDAGPIGAEGRERIDRLCRELRIDLRDAAVLENRLRRQRRKPPLDWRQEFAAAARSLRGPDGLSEYDRLRLYDLYLKRERLSVEQAERVLESLRAPADMVPASRQPRRLLAAAGVASGIVALAVALGFGAGLGGDSATTAPARITADTTWASGSTIRLRDAVLVEPGRTLTIEPGVRVLGDFGSALVVPSGARLHARGRPDAPIVFTSAQPAGERRRGDWGGVVLLGKAPVNTGTERIEGLPEDDPRGIFGGDDAAYSCGVLEYARIEFAGFELSANNELNGLTLGGCGSGTVLRHIQVHRGLDDGIEFFGGTADLQHALITGSGDDGLDWDLGWQGRVQHLIVQQHADDGDNAIEADNLGDDHDAEPRSAPQLYNVTLIGGGPGAEGQRGMTLREGTAGQFRNLLAVGFPLELLDIRDDATVAQARAGALDFAGVVLGDIGAGDGVTVSAEDPAETADDSAFPEAALFAEGTLELPPGIGLLPAVQDPAAPQFAPAAAPWPDTLPVRPPRGEFWDEAARYPGAVPAGVEQPWYAGWTAFPLD